MSLSSHSLHYSRMLLLFAVLTLGLSSCSPTQLLGTLLGGGPNVNGQVGQVNQQGLNITKEAPSVTVRPKGRIDHLDQSTTNNTEVDPWLILLLILGWLAPSPGEISRRIKNIFRRKPNA